ncbi:putative splicing factor, arginine/serine-rich 7 [Trichinella pseudospiralis]|uniref:glutathione transferase n=1 Tax=Trichinella pseudospiralis TaxID=6337 RepID=A0A0V1J7U6_TRIPS|nr:putative splicing factor, arginine/serine-rich 7 [Trichinella pseudospiralis]KRZ31041.1 putative splicing factor, arginine/serine-rich 7 [Trichinella pseudospiralis]
MAPIYKLSYFDVRGLAEPIRLLFHDQKIEFIDHRFDRNEWSKIKSTILMFGQVPCLYENGNAIVQSGAIMRHLGRRFGRKCGHSFGNFNEITISALDLYGNADEMTYVDEMYDGICDLRKKYAPFIYTEHSEEEVEKFTKEVLLVELQKFENLLKGKKYILNDKISFADYSLFDMLDTLSMLSPACLSSFPALKCYRLYAVRLMVGVVCLWYDEFEDCQSIQRAENVADQVDSTSEVQLAFTFSTYCSCERNSLKVATLAMAPKYKLAYFAIRGLAEPIRLLLHDQKVNFEDERFDKKDWPEIKPKMLFGQVPCLYEDDKPIVQSGAIMRHLGRRFGLYGNADEMTYVDVVYEGIVDLRLKYARLIYGDFSDEAKCKFVNEVLPVELARFEKLLTGKQYILNDEITFADYALVELLDVLLVLSSTCLEKFPALKTFHAQFMDRPNLKKYLSSDFQSERRWNEKVYLVQISSISPLLTREQIYHMFSYFGRIEEFRMYPLDTNPSNFIGQTKLCYIRYVRSSSADTAQHMTNTVFIDRALICVPVPEGKIPEEDVALMLGGPTLPGQRQLPLGVVSEMRHADGRDLIVTIDPKLTQLGLPAYPPLSGSLPLSTVEEIRRTVFISGLSADVDKYDLMMFLNDNIGEVMYLRMAGRRDAAQRCAYVEFSSQLSVVNALQKNGLLYKGQKLRMWHSNTSIAKPLAKTLDMAKKEVEEAVRQSGILATAAPFNEDEVDRLIQRANSPLYRRHSRRHSRRRTRSRRRYSRSRDRSPRTPPRRYYIRSSTPPHLRLRRRSRRCDRRRRRSSSSSASSRRHRLRLDKSTARRNASRERRSPKKDVLGSSSSFKRSRGSRSPAETGSKELRKRIEMESKFVENEADLVDVQLNEERAKEKKQDKNDSPKHSSRSNVNEEVKPLFFKSKASNSHRRHHYRNHHRHRPHRQEQQQPSSDSKQDSSEIKSIKQSNDSKSSKECKESKSKSYADDLDSKEKKTELSSTLTPERLSKRKFIGGHDELSAKGSNSGSMKANTADEQEEQSPETKRHRSEYGCAEVIECSQWKDKGQTFSSPVAKLKGVTGEKDGATTMATEAAEVEAEAEAEVEAVDLEEKKDSQNDERSEMNEDCLLEVNLSGGQSRHEVDDKQQSKESSSKKHRSSEKKNRSVELSKLFEEGSSLSSRRKSKKKSDRSPTPERKEDRHRRRKHQQDAVELLKRSSKVDTSGQQYRKEKYSKRSKRKSKHNRSSKHGRSTRRVRSSSSSSATTSSTVSH